MIMKDDQSGSFPTWRVLLANNSDNKKQLRFLVLQEYANMQSCVAVITNLTYWRRESTTQVWTIKIVPSENGLKR